MTGTAHPQPGDFAVVSAGGLAGRAIAFGEWLNGDGFGTWEHAFIYIGGRKIIQAEPGGANEVPLGGYAHILWSSGVIPLTGPERHGICKAARGYLGVPYSFLDYAALVTHRLHIPAPGLRGYIATTKHQICSQLVDNCYAQAGVHLFDDGRWPGYVTPASLAKLLGGLGMKLCKRCRVFKAGSRFTPDPRLRDGMRSWCRDCVAEYNRNWSSERARAGHTGDKIKCLQCWTPLSPAVGRKYADHICRDCAPDDRWRSIVRRYGIDRHMFNAMYFEQDGKCAIESCQREAKNIDHDHGTGAVRGLLCQGCNVAIGFLEAGNWLTGALNYLAETALT